MGLPLASGQTAAPAPAPAPAAIGATKLATTAGPPAAATAGAAVGGSVAGGTAAGAEAAAKKPRKFWIDGKFRELKKGEVRPYTPPTLPPEPEAAPSTIKVFETIKLEDGSEPQALARPYYGAPMIGTIAPGSRLLVRGELIAKSSRYCHGKKWLALAPFGWVCAEHGKATDQPAQTESWLRMVPGERVPFRYVMVSSSEPLPMWVSLEAFKEGLEPERMLEKGDSVAIEKLVKHEGQSYYQSVEGKILPVKGTYQMSATSQWHGLLIDDKTPLPFGWMLPETTRVYAAPGEGAPVNNLKRRTRVDILEETTIKNKRYVKIRVSAVQQSAFPVGTEPLPAPEGAPEAAKPAAPAAAAAKPVPPATVAAAPAATPAPIAAAPIAAKPGAALAAPVATAPAAPPAPDTFWVLAAYVNEVRLRPRPAGVTSSRWFDADLGEQVLVAYEGEKPIYATLVSSGKNNATPLGNYPVWARVAAITMKSQPYDDKAYFVNMVPWSTFFQAHNAIHGAYWHDRFGGVKSHGCINVAPLDARWVYEWLDPKVPAGWTSLRPVDLRESPTLHVHDEHRRPAFHQDRPIGPVDREDEAERLEEAEKRRVEQAAAAPAAPGTAPAAPAAPVAAPAPAPAAAPAR